MTTIKKRFIRNIGSIIKSMKQRQLLKKREAKAEQIKQIEEVLDIISLSVSKFEIAVHDEVSK